MAGFLSAVLLAGCHRQTNAIVAEVGDRFITADQFRIRYAAYLSVISSRDNILLRKKVLDNMINETLIFEDLHRSGMDADSAAISRMTQVRNEALVMGYARQISLDTMTIGEAELGEEFRRFKTKVKARYLYGKSEEEAWKLKDRIERGATFESLAREVFEDPGLANNGGDLGLFGWGEMEPGLEEAAYSLRIGQVSEPIKLKIGYGIVRVDDRIEQPITSEFDYSQAKEKLEQAVRKRKVLRLLTDATSAIGSELSPTFNEPAVTAVFARWWQSVVADDPPKYPEEAQVHPEVSLAAMPFMKFSRGSWTVGDFLGRLAQTTTRERKRVKTADDLKTVATGLATREVLLERAHAAGLEEDSDVVNQVKRVGDEYYLRRWASSIQDTVGRAGWDEGELMKYFEEHRAEHVLPPEVNIGEILVRTESEARVTRKRIDEEGGFSDLARKKSIRLWAAKRGGELGFGTKATFGVLGDTFLNAKIGEVIGPQRVDPYYGIFKILAKRDGRLKTFGESRDEIIRSLAFLRKQEAFKRAVDQLRSRTDIRIHENVLADIMIN
ncbi:MAG TPA: peptidylprolyl isomerase [Bacteroidota bacterium]|nr:peptidylprolyl isomerase [Bacteroidota bacterium]